jgi:hypothetical protein
VLIEQHILIEGFVAIENSSYGVKIIGVGRSNFGRLFVDQLKNSRTLKKIATENVVDFSIIAKRQTTLLMCGLTVIALILMASSNQPTTNRRELQHVLARGLLDVDSYLS